MQLFECHCLNLFSWNDTAKQIGAIMKAKHKIAQGNIANKRFKAKAEFEAQRKEEAELNERITANLLKVRIDE